MRIGEIYNISESKYKSKLTSDYVLIKNMTEKNISVECCAKDRDTGLIYVKDRVSFRRIKRPEFEKELSNGKFVLYNAK